MPRTTASTAAESPRLIHRTLPPPELRGRVHLITWDARGTLQRLMGRARGSGLGHTALYIEPQEGYPGMYISYTQASADKPDGLCDHTWDFSTMAGEPYSILTIDGARVGPMMETAVTESARGYSARHNCSTVVQEVLIAGLPDSSIRRPRFFPCTPVGLLGRIEAALVGRAARIPSTDERGIMNALGRFLAHPTTMPVVIPARTGMAFRFAAVPEGEDSRVPIIGLGKRIPAVNLSRRFVPYRRHLVTEVDRAHEAIRSTSRDIRSSLTELEKKILSDEALRVASRSSAYTSGMMTLGCRKERALIEDPESEHPHT